MCHQAMESPDGELRSIGRNRLKQYRGYHGRPIYLAVKGVVYDVSKARDIYGPGCDYHLFAGRECARALAKLELSVLECREETDDLDECAQQTLEEWITRFKSQYPIVGTIGKDSIPFGHWVQFTAIALVASVCLLTKN